MLNRKFIFLICVFEAAFFALCVSGAEEIDLAGKWKVKLGTDEANESVLPSQDNFQQDIRLPSSLAEHGLGEDPAVDSPWVGSIKQKEWNKKRYEPYKTDDNFKMPFWLQPKKVYMGVAWYRREVTIPQDWSGKHVELVLERPHWKTTVWIDGQKAGSRDSLSTPHVYDLTNKLKPGRHSLTVQVDNRMIVNVGPNSHSVSDHTQSNWNGLVGELKLVAKPSVWIEDLQIYPDASELQAKVNLLLGNAGNSKGEGVLSWKVLPRQLSEKGKIPELPAEEKTVRWNEEGAAVEIELAFQPGTPLWDEFSPNLYELKVALETADGAVAEKSAPFGLRDLDVVDKRLKINGRNLFLRGTLECAIFPDTGYPPTDVEYWRKIVRTCKEFGLNHIRFHSWCPPKAAFEAADELGFYYQVECASWANFGASIGNGKPLDKWLYEEGERITRAYANHPSFVMMAYGNEPAGPERANYLSKWCEYWKKHEPRCLHTSAGGWPKIPQSEFHNIYEPRIQGPGEGLRSRINARPPETMTDYSGYVAKNSRPIVSHEIGQWCAYPNFAEMKKYKGVLQPKNFEIFRDFLAKNNMEHQAEDFLMASGKLQVLCYKEEIESALRTEGFGGFQLLDLHDFPGQGTALVGVLDPFWDPKPYITADEYSRFCDATVPLARMEKRYWTEDEVFAAEIEYYNHGPAAIADALTVWRVVDENGRIALKGELSSADLPIDNGIEVGRIEFDCSELTPARKYTLVVAIQGTDIENDWGFWVFPSEVKSLESDQIEITDELGSRQLDRLAKGGKVLLMVPPAKVKSDVAIGFSSVFWNTAWTEGQAPHTLGILCDPEDAVFDSFPTDYHSDWQWWELIHGSAAMVLDDLPADLQPLVQPIDTWFRAHKLGLLFEAHVNGGKLMVCSMDLAKNLDQRLVARQLRHSIIEYMGSAAFDPQTELSAEQVASLFSRPLPASAY